MTIGAWIGFGFCAIMIICVAVAIVVVTENKITTLITVLVAVVLCIACYGGIHWYMTNSADGQRAYKSQQSRLDGGLERTVTVYSYDGDVLGEWSGKFDVTENDQETFFDIDGKRVIIQGGIIINEEKAQ